MLYAHYYFSILEKHLQKNDNEQKNKSFPMFPITISINKIYKDLYWRLLLLYKHDVFYDLFGLVLSLTSTPGHGFSFGSRSAYVRGKSMYGIFLLWKIILLTFISFLHFLSFGKNMLGHTHNIGNPASCSLCFWHRG